MFHRATGILLIGTLVSAWNANAASLTTRLTEKGPMILLKGDIAREDSEAVANLILAAKAERRVIRGLQLDSPGGNLLGGMSLASLMHNHPELSTMIVPGATCASACFLVFAAGHEKFADYESFVGVHGVADKAGQVTEETEAATLEMARFCQELGVPSRITEKLIATPPDEIVWLSADDLRSMGATMVGRPVQSPRGGQREIGPVRRDQVSEAKDLPLPKFQPDLVKRAFDAAERADYATAIRVWRVLAAQGHGASQYNLGQMYYAGQGVARDFAAAIKWYRSAAEKGVPDAQLSLGLAYALGRGVPQDLAEAYKWLELATEGYASEKVRMQALKAQTLITAQMTQSEVAESARRARDWTSLRRNEGLTK
jgi:hypothetical protein